MHSISRKAALSASVTHGCASSTGGQQDETHLHNRHCNGRRSARRDPPSTVAKFLSSPDSNRLRGRLAAACGECSRHVHWSMASGLWCSCQCRPAVFSPDVCFPESCHSGPCVHDGDHLLNKRMRVSVTALMVFTHVYSVYTLPNTRRPTCTPPVKVRWWPSRVLHIINVRHRELSNVYYIGLPTRQIPVTAVNTRWPMRDLVAFNRRV